MKCIYRKYIGFEIRTLDSSPFGRRIIERKCKISKIELYASMIIFLAKKSNVKQVCTL